MIKKQTLKDYPLPKAEPLRLTWLIYLLVFVIALLGGSVYLRFIQQEYKLEQEKAVVDLAQAGKALLPAQQIDDLLAAKAPQKESAEREIKLTLNRLVASTRPIEDAFVITQQEGQEQVLVRVETDLANDCANPEASLYSSLLAAKPEKTPHILDLHQPLICHCQCGTLLRVFIPLKRGAEKETVAIFGISYATSAWLSDLKGKLLPQLLLVICFILLIQACLFIWFKQIDLKRKNQALATMQNLYMSMFEHAPIGIALMHRGKTAEKTKYVSVNPVGSRILGRDIARLQDTSWLDLTHPDDTGNNLELYERFISRQINTFDIKKRILHPDGTIIWINLKVSQLLSDSLGDLYYLVLFEDITARKLAEDALKESERSKSVFLANIKGMAYRCKNDADWTMEFVSDGCLELTGYEAAGLVDNHDVAFNDLIAVEYRKLVWHKWQQNLAGRKKTQLEYELVSKSGQRKWVMEFGQGVYDDQGQAVAIEGVIYDVTASKLHDAEVFYLQSHDYLTGLFNRFQLEKEQERLDQVQYLPLSVLICDIDRLAAINDEAGFTAGDLLLTGAANLLRELAKPEDVLARTSGSEFVLLLPGSDSKAAYARRQMIQHAISRFNAGSGQHLLSMTIAYATRTSAKESLAKVISYAHEYLKHRKLLNKNSSQNAILTSIMAALYAKSQETEEHGERLARLTCKLGERLQLPAKQLDDLQLLAMLHDIGKIAVDDYILKKPGALSEDEWVEIRKHPEAGYQIAKSTLQLEHVAEYILYHHERWDGTGYPARLKGEQIPLLARMLALADAYDAMTVGRSYSQRLSWQEALVEIERCAGSQFDPQLAQMFVAMIRQEKAG